MEKEQAATAGLGEQSPESGAVQLAGAPSLVLLTPCIFLYNTTHTEMLSPVT